MTHSPRGVFGVLCDDRGNRIVEALDGRRRVAQVPHEPVQAGRRGQPLRRPNPVVRNVAAGDRRLVRDRRSNSGAAVAPSRSR